MSYIEDYVDSGILEEPQEENNMQEIKHEGTLKVFATTAGIKMLIGQEETQWLNPAEDIKEDAIAKYAEYKKLEGSKISATFITDEKGKPRWTNIELLDAKTEPVQQAIQQLKNNMKPQVNTKTTITPRINAETPQKSTQIIKEQNQGPIEKNPERPETQEEYAQIYTSLNKIQCDVKKLEVPGRPTLTYISWAESWAKLKEKYEDAHYYVHNNQYTGMPYFADHTGAFVKVSVTIGKITHTQYLPVLDNRNQPVKQEYLNTFHINTSIQRCLAKAIAMHGLGLYVYKGEDLPEHPEGVQEENIQ